MLAKFKLPGGAYIAVLTMYEEEKSRFCQKARLYPGASILRNGVTLVVPKNGLP